MNVERCFARQTRTSTLNWVKRAVKESREENLEENREESHEESLDQSGIRFRKNNSQNAIASHELCIMSLATVTNFLQCLCGTDGVDDDHDPTTCGSERDIGSWTRAEMVITRDKGYGA
jgi:hypothetical protein